MIPTIALMIAVYGSARLLNDCFKRYPASKPATIFTIIVSLVAIGILCLLGLLINLPSQP
jgi:hypothetical protein